MEVMEKGDGCQAKSREKYLLKCIHPVDGPVPDDPGTNDGSTQGSCHIGCEQGELV
jgi:hypothetical protein